LASALRTERSAAGGPVRLKVDVEANPLRAQIQLLAEELAIRPVNARLEYDSDRGGFTELTPSAWGQWLDVEATLQQVLTAAEAEEREVTLPLIPEKPTVSAANAHHLGIEELVAESTTSFEKSSQARMQNIAIATSRFHGVVVEPDGVFSFNAHLGEVSAEGGYEESLIIMGDRTRVGIGGGVCQVATTAFRAAFWGGYPIEERWAHGYRVRAYEPPVGLDATVYAPIVDLRFRNDTPHHLLVQTETDLEARTVAFRFYSTPTGRRVEMEDPVIENRVPHGPDIVEEDPTLPVGTRRQVDWSVDGLDATIVRRAYQGEKLLREDVFFSRYRPWQARFRVGTMPIEEDASRSD
jgi:vancomycin resistance protein YoaR